MSPSPTGLAEVCWAELRPTDDSSEDEDYTQGLNMLVLGLPPRVLRRRQLRHGSATALSAQGGHADTVIIFDWDDTLFCTSALERCGPAELLKLEQLVRATLELALELGTTLIVTNANDGWVQQSAGIHMPRLLPTLKRVPVVSARDVYEDHFPEEPKAWKRETFWKLLRTKKASELNLIVLGDSVCEIEAADIIGKALKHVPLVKTVKFKAEPSTSELLSQLQVIEGELGKLVAENRSTSKALVQDWASCRPHESCRWRLSEVRPRCSRRPTVFSRGTRLRG